ncbi:FAD-dependent oxidoreductase [Streptomyces sp. NPDC053048]|uniref:FAD-dependent oxidoreductase n=1 Tax=Streptomyces sp. NPDC053048 TaxID=3365694 RepID=UPI0037D22385
MVVSDTYYPQFARLLDELGVATRRADMSTEVACVDCGFLQRSAAPVEVSRLPQRPPRVSGEVWKRYGEDVERFVPRLEQAAPVNTSTSVRAVRRTADGVLVRDAAGRADDFDKAVIAVPATHALALLVDPTPEQRSTPVAFACTPVEAVLHTDGSLFEKDAGHCGVNIQLGCANALLPSPVANHQNMDALWGRGAEDPLYATYSPLPVVNPSRVDAREYYWHPAINKQYVTAQSRLPAGCPTACWPSRAPTTATASTNRAALPESPPLGRSPACLVPRRAAARSTAETRASRRGQPTERAAHTRSGTRSAQALAAFGPIPSGAASPHSRTAGPGPTAPARYAPGP